MQQPSLYIIGVTGGIGSGKSVVSRLLRLMGVPVYDCDREAKRLMDGEAAIRKALIEAVGAEVYDASGRLNRRYLASYMFGHTERVDVVNRIVHPAIRADFRRWARQTGSPIVAVESAILFEAGMESDVDAVWMVHAPENVRVERAVLRDAASEEAVRNRMKNQLGEQEYLERADRVIRNDGGHSLIAQLEELLGQLPDRN